MCSSPERIPLTFWRRITTRSPGSRSIPGAMAKRPAHQRACNVLMPALYGVTELDTTTFGLAPWLLVIVVLIACLAPARHAARIDPVSALRDE